MARRPLAVCILMVVAITVVAQRRPGRVVLQPNPCRVRIVVTDRDSHTAIENVTVQLMDAVGFASAVSEKNTDSAGQVEFQSWTGAHRVRVRGTDIQEYSGDFEIAENEAVHVERIFVVRKDTNAASNSGATAPIPALRLKVPAKARKEFEKGSRAMEQQRWPESRKYFQAAINLYPDYDLAYNGLGVACSEMHDLPAARQAFQKAIALNGKFAGAQRNLARLMLSERNYQEAASLLNQSLTVESQNAWALTNAAYAELQLHRFKEAAEHALQVHKLPHEGLANGHVIAAYALDALGRQTEAVLQWKQYLKEDPKGPNAKRAQEELLRLTKSPQT